MCGGGGSYTPPPDNSLELERMQREEREQNRLREEERTNAENARKRTAFDTGLTTAVNNFRTASQQRLRDMGLDPNAYGSLIESAITGARGQVADLDPNPGQYFTDALLDNQISRVQGDRRASYQRQATSAFGDGFENSLFADTADDPFIEAVLGRQRGEAVNALDLARRRGNLDETGYNAALARLGEMEAAGRSTANTLGGSVIQGYRQQVRDIGDEAREAAGSYTLGGNFDLGGYTTRRDNTVNDLRGRLEGDVNAALNGQQFFDLGDIITRGGVAQGPVNPRVGLTDILAERERVRNTDRGLGAGGVF